MSCPECGYVFGDFDKECLRCKCNPGYSAQIKASAPIAPETMATPPCEPSSAPEHSNTDQALPYAAAETASVQENRKPPKRGVLTLAVVAFLVAVIAVTIYWVNISTDSGVRTGLPFLPSGLHQPEVVSFAAVTTESKASYSDTTFENVIKYRIVEPSSIETDSGTGWNPYLPPPVGEQPVAIGAARTMEKMAYSDTTWIKVHVVLLTKSGNVYDSEDGVAWKLFMASDGKATVGVAAASYAEKQSYSDTTWWHLEVLRLLSDGSIESTEGDTWKPFAPTNGKRILSISAAATKEKQSYSDTTWWKVNVFLLLDNGNVEESDDGASWTSYGTEPGAVSLAVYNVEEKASYSDTTWEHLHVDYALANPSETTIISNQEPLLPRASPTAVPPPAPAVATAPPATTVPSTPPPAFQMKTKAGGGTPPDLSRFKHWENSPTTSSP